MNTTDKTPKQYVKEAFKRGDKDQIQRYLKRYWQLQVKQKQRDIIDNYEEAKEIFGGDS